MEHGTIDPGWRERLKQHARRQRAARKVRLRARPEKEMPEAAARLWEEERERQEIERLVDNLEPVSAGILYYRYLQGLKWSQVAARMGYSESHCKRLHARLFQKK